MKHLLYLIFVVGILGSIAWGISTRIHLLADYLPSQGEASFTPPKRWIDLDIRPDATANLDFSSAMELISGEKPLMEELMAYCEEHPFSYYFPWQGHPNPRLRNIEIPCRDVAP